MIANGDAPLVLPADTPLEEIRAVGPDLHIKLADGSVIVIPNGALDLPEIVIGNVRVPPANIAALLVGREPEPAAGALQSSGGNFVVDPGSIGPAFDLGDLLPPTDFAFTSEVDDDFLIDRLDNKVSVTIVTPEAPAGAIDATALVAESGLGPRGSEPPGSDSAADSESFAGKILIDARDGPATVAINGVGVTEVGQEIATSLGVLKITAISPSEIAYTYTLTDNVLGPEPFDEITVVVTDSDGDVGVATVTISVADDAPTARNDSLDVEPATYIPYTGNLVTGAGTTSGSSGADTKGADGASVTGVRAGAGPVIVPGTAVQGQFGTLVVQPDGAFTYTRGSGTPGGVEDVFSYQLTDGDGDVSSAIVTFRIADSGAVILSVPDGEGSVVNEAGLAARGDEPAGSDEAADSEMTGGTITFSAPDGPPMVEINGERIVAVGQ
ncbi:MAG: Ig-like domain-containing protein, partial [Cypionkella sp.]